MTKLNLSERRLDCFYETVRAGSIRGAADRLDLEPSVVSRHVQQLEDDLGTQLLERRGRGVVPTEAAQLVIEHCEERRSSETSLRSRLDELNGLERGHLHLAVGEGFVDELTGRLLDTFCRRYPKLKVTLELVGATDGVRMIAQDRAHLGITLCAPADDAVRVLKERSQPLCAVIAADHPLAKRRGRLSLHELTECALILPSAGTGLGSLVQMARFADKVELVPHITTNSIHVMMHFVKTNTGVAFLSKQAVAKELDEGSVVALRTDNSVFESASSQILVRSGRRFSAALHELVNTIQLERFFENRGVDF